MLGYFLWRGSDPNAMSGIEVQQRLCSPLCPYAGCMRCQVLTYGIGRRVWRGVRRCESKR
eukprot:982606-Rhodomonas_salina.2